MKTMLLPLGALLTTLALVIAAPPEQTPAERVAAGLVAHEWGTFTSVQGADGEQMIWNPQVVSDLPNFVYERNRELGINPLMLAKLAMPVRQRMETPVIYFYSDKPRTVDVSVDFPGGEITEWYPQKSAANLLGTPEGAPALRWKKVEILPKEEAAALTLPKGGDGSHYYAARATDAAMLRTVDAQNKAELESFLFYRGTGSFAAPLTVKLVNASRKEVSVTNTGTEPLRHLFFCESTGQAIAWVTLEKLAPGETRTLILAEAKQSSPTELATALQTGLVAEGLYEKEASAMVKTWENSWLGEPGLRVLYTLPRKWTDATLPLTIAPAPQAIERVMVGRAEIITPAMEQALLAASERYLSASAEVRAQIAKETHALGMGRFIEPAWRRMIMAEKRGPAFNSATWELLQKVTALDQAKAKATVAPAVVR